MHITVLGVGLVGGTIAEDLVQAGDYDVTAVDLDSRTLDKIAQKLPLKVIQADLQESSIIESLVAESDLVINAVPGFMGFKTLKAIIDAGKNVVDISPFEEDAFLLDETALSQGVTAVVDCGVAPGLCNILCGHVDSLMDNTESYSCYVGGLPVLRQWPFEYKALFSPTDVIEEYTRPARFVEEGREVVRPALSDVELMDFEGIGTLEAFNTDGVRTLRKTMNIPNMKEKTLRYPGHANLMRIFRDSGFFSTTPVEVDGMAIRPLQLTSYLLFDQWQLEDGQEDITLMKVTIEGKKDGKPCRYTYDLLDRYDRKTQTTAMARTTGYTCTIVARQILNGMFNQKGICPAEYVGRKPDCFENLMAEYNKRNLGLTETITKP